MPNGSEDMDLAKDNVYVKKLSIPKWSGKLYLNLSSPVLDKEKSNILMRNS